MGENALYDMPFAPIARAVTVITSILEVRIDNLSLVQGSGDLTLVSQVFSDQTVQLRIKDGTDDERYRVTVRAAFDNGDELEAEGELQVRDIR